MVAMESTELRDASRRTLAVIGAGPAGLLAAGRAAELGARVLLFDKNPEAGVKLLISGKGRCNFTNAEPDIQRFIATYGKSGRFLFSAISSFGPEDIRSFFAARGVPSVVERGKRVFPESRIASDIRDALVGYARDTGVLFRFGEEVRDLSTDGETRRIRRIVLRSSGEPVDAVILATGGASYPRTGSTGDGYRMAQKIGHTITTPRPSIAPIRIRQSPLFAAQGLDLKNVSVSAWIDGKKRDERFGDLSVTHFGLSGPIAMDLSREIHELMQEGDLVLRIDFKPALTYEMLDARFQREFLKRGREEIRSVLRAVLPEPMVGVILEVCRIYPPTPASEITKEERRSLCSHMKDFPVIPEGLLGFNWAIVTSGGIALKEVEPKTMRSKLVPNLFFAGEILDIDGPTGGFNLQVCWSTGWVAGEQAAQALSEG